MASASAAAWLDGVRVVLVTDRRLMGGAAELGAAVARAVERRPAGSVLVQVREKDVDGGELLRLVRAAMASGAPVMVNDRLDVALAAGAAGVHLPEAGLSVADARALAPPGFVIGRSMHEPAALFRELGLEADAMTHEAAAMRGPRATGGADLIQLGPIFETPGKGPAIGVQALRDARAILGAGVHLVAVGGISDDARVAACRDAGADAVAMIRAAWR